MTVAELGQRMSSRELTEWAAFYSIEPFGGEVEDVRAAISTTAIVNSANGIRRAAKPEQFRLVDASPAPTELDPAALYDKMRGMGPFAPRK